jgi:putative DNA primase/helicase
MHLFTHSGAEKRNIQFTDSTNAARLIREQGRNIRYNKAWKKWLVWNGAFWETDDSGALVHEKELEMVRNIYDDILKTDDHRERMDIEKYGMLSESVRRRESCIKAAQWVGKHFYPSESWLYG